MQYHRRFTGLLMDIEPQFAVLVLIIDRGGVVGASTAGQYAGIEDACRHSDCVTLISDTNDHDLVRVVGNIAASGQTRL